ncbi:calmodulin-regulated spectrin-associated protein 3-like isoform X1 [Carassius auratus]|uniref:Calmodulin-regulated spectrin-associated protein 3-like isoform X1 n=2 Tax=Carassius auratus TaxID=7957 RepID=A0A6P6J8K4_CARAU|nr:calmodulin-regulated spectrin-associated protein 3-like isoform X1 [Carassius auratus]XP_026056716.1 calmodulin-regulated spectrin-associated protein 3-like isoform X1 [Carassius auratus]XP_026056725.1 calmodulin-regulated spectrin-associated protein 3-like isoform X1 [Carassius auratus]
MVDSNAMRKTFVVPDIKPLDQYDLTRARICASVGWLLGKSYGNAENVPVELRDPFYCDQYEQEHLKPPVTRLLLSPELYCRTYGLLLGGSPGAEGPPKDIPALLQVLGRKGLAPKDQNAPVTEAELRQKPIKMSAHLELIDALMAVGAMEMVSRVLASGGSELLGTDASWDRALLYWVNTLNQKLKEQTEGTLNDASQPSTEPQPVQPSCPTRWYWKLVPILYRKDRMQSKLKPYFPVVNEVKDLSNGCAIAAVIHYYCPGLLRLEDVCMKDSMSVADSLYNLQLIREFCDSCLKSCCPLALEDLLYSPAELKTNILSFLAELLYWFEVSKPEFVQPLQDSELTETSGRTGNGNSGSSNSGSPSIFKRPFLPISSPVTAATGSLTQSTSMSHVETAGRTWTKKPLSRPLSAVSFSIPFGLDSDVDIVMGNPVITRSVSSDNLNPAGQSMTREPYTPPEDLSHLLSKAPGPNGPQRASWATQTRPLLAEENGIDDSETGELPTIEEALQIIHNEEKMEPRLHPDGAPDGFYLHSLDDPANARLNGSPVTLSSSAPSRSGMLYNRSSGIPPEPSRTRHPSEGSRDDDSVLRDGSMDSDASEDLPKIHSTPATPASGPRITEPRCVKTPESGVRMTNFAERKKKLVPEQVQPSEPQVPQMTTWAKKLEESPSKSPAVSTEMSELGARLEEKRKAIEAQKKRIEAIFAKHRQRLGKSAFLQLKKEQEDGDGEEGRQGEVGTSSIENDLSRLALEEKLARLESEEEQDEQQQEQLKKGPSVEEEGNIKSHVQQDNPVEKEKAGVGIPGGKETAPLGNYNNAVSKLSAALNSLQNDMQRLSEQQNQLMKKKVAPNIQASGVPPSPKPSTAASSRLSRESNRNLSSASSSPSPSRKIANHTAPPKSPSSHRRAQSAPPKSPKLHHPRPAELKTPASTRVITLPQNVDNIPHLRRVSPWQCRDQNSSSFSIGTSSQSESRSASSLARTEDNISDTGSSEDHTIFSMELDSGSSQVLARKDRQGGGSSSGAPSECSFESDLPAAGFNGKHKSLIEISLSSLKALEGEGADQSQDNFSDSMSDQTEPEISGGVGFFFKQDEARPEDEMERRRAALLEKQQKRAEEIKRRRQEQEREREPSRSSSMDESRRGEERPQTPSTPPPPRTPPPEGTPQRRGDFTRQEYERRHQLKIMEDLDKVLRQKPTTVRGVKKQRPKTVFRDDSDLSRSPAKGFMGSRLNKVYSHSTTNLSSMANDNGTLTVRKSPSRSHSPSRLLSPGRLAAQNGDWENESTISSAASIPEYTGPKLYKEPSFKSNKFIIHNAISRCCLAGKVNEPQKNKIVEEMEKSPANHFLILFRDASCQFRAVYTMNPETEEMVRLVGVGPRVINLTMVESIYKYSSDRKQFTTIPSKTMSMSVDAFTIPGHLWERKRPGTPKKLGTPK